MNLFQAILLGGLYWLSYCGFGCHFLNLWVLQPLPLSVLVGLILGDVPTAMIVGATIQPMYLSQTQAGWVITNDTSAAGIITAAVVITSGMQSGELHNISIVTNSLVNLELLAPHCKAILAGGIYTPERKSFAGYLSERFITQFHFNKSFIGVDGFTFEEGFATADPDFARLSGAAATAADETFVLMDSSKIGRRSFVVYDKYVRIHKIITDSHADRLVIDENADKDQADCQYDAVNELPAADIPAGLIHINRSGLQSDDGQAEEEAAPVQMAVFLQQIFPAAEYKIQGGGKNGADDIGHGQGRERVDRGRGFF